MEKILKFMACWVIIFIAFPVTIFELIFKIVIFITLCSILLIMMFFAPLFKNFSWPDPIQKFIDYVFSSKFIVTCKVIDSYKNALNLN